MGSDARINKLKGRSPESCLSWLRLHEGHPKHDLFTLDIEDVQDYERVYGKFCIETLHERHNGIQRLVVCLSEYLQEPSRPLVSNITRQCWSYLVKW